MARQYYLHRIDSKLSKRQSGVDRIIRGQHAEASGRVEAAARRNEQVRKGLLNASAVKVIARPHVPTGGQRPAVRWVVEPR
jgi:hypothetical protein